MHKLIEIDHEQKVCKSDPPREPKGAYLWRFSIAKEGGRIWVCQHNRFRTREGQIVVSSNNFSAQIGGQ